MRNAGEVCVWHVVLHGINHSRKAENAHGDEEEEAAHLLVALSQGEAKRPQTRGVTRQLQDPKDPHQSHDPQHLPQLSHLPHRLHVSLMLHVIILAVKDLQNALQILRQDCD